MVNEFEKVARAAGFTNFRREGNRYCHADLELAYQWWMRGWSAQSRRH